ncbi:MAG TPA: hypothetical protein VF723_01165 [Pyrinomonadaceae bacterium]|jgi:hypothetical protein
MNVFQRLTPPSHKSLAAALLCFSALLVFQGCNMRRVLRDEVRTTLGSHVVSIRPAGGWMSEGNILSDEREGKLSCNNVTVIIKDEQLLVNDKSYGELKPGDAVSVVNGKVLVNSREIQEVARN